MDKLVVVPELFLKSSLKSHAIAEILKTKVLEEVKKIPNIGLFKHHIELTELICTIIENSIKKKHKINKKKLALDIINELFGLSPEDSILLDHQIEYILENGLVKKNRKKLTSKIYDGVTSLSCAKKND